MRSFNKMRNIEFISILTILLITFSCAVQAASFDCERPIAKVERLICDSESVSMLDNDLNFTYQENLNLADDKQRQHLIAEQNHWIKSTRNLCKNENCLERAYWARLAELKTFFEPHSPLYKYEADKAQPIKEILATSALRLTDISTPSKFCNEILSNLKEMNNIRFVDTVAQALSYESTVFDPYKKNCKNKAPWYSGETCTIKEGGPTNCITSYALPLYKLYKIPLPERSSSSTYILYRAGSYYPQTELTVIPEYTLSGGYSSGFVELDVDRCQTTMKNKLFAPIQTNEHPGEDYNSIIEYQQQYYFLTLASNDGAYSLDVNSLNHRKSGVGCTWLPVRNSIK